MPDVTTLFRWVDTGQLDQYRLNGVPPSLCSLVLGWVLREDVLEEVGFLGFGVLLKVLVGGEERFPPRFEGLPGPWQVDAFDLPLQRRRLIGRVSGRLDRNPRMSA